MNDIIRKNFENMDNKLGNLVTGGSGFLGSYLIDRLMNAGEKVICLDNFFTGREKNISKWINHPDFELIHHDVTIPISLEVDRIWHLACPASPINYQKNPIKIEVFTKDQATLFMIKTTWIKEKNIFKKG